MTKINTYKPLLSIAIPTYNRAEYLDVCLAQICTQSADYCSYVEIIVSDNCSTDKTENIVNRYKDNGNDIFYTKNSTNLGVDSNIEQCFSLANGKYVWIFGDDDLLLDGAISNIVNLLQAGDYGNIYLSNYWYHNSYIKKVTNAQSTFDFAVFEDKEVFLKKINYWVTFCTGNITNKDILPSNFNSKKYLGTELTLVHWILTATILAEKNVYVNTEVLACQAGNSSGNYKLFKVFGEYLRTICFDVFSEYHISDSVLKYTDNCLLLHFFPSFIIGYKRKHLGVFTVENPKVVFYKEYKNNLVFWVLNYPLFFLPKKIDSLYLMVVKKLVQSFI